MTDFKARQETFEQMLQNLIELLPDSYNKEVPDTNFYKILRALALELADAKIEIEEVSQNTYLETAKSADAIYRNFGVMVKLTKDPEWDDEKYRSLVKGVMQSLLKGPSKQSLIDGFKLFTNFKVNLYELYKDYQKLDPAAYEGFNPKFTFALEIEKPIDTYVDQEALIRDANYVINIIKPAHTLSLNIITIIGDENYRRYYAIDKKLGVVIQNCIERKINKRINENLAHRFNEEAVDYSEINGVTIEQAENALRQISNGISVTQYEQSIEDLANSLYNDYILNIDECSIPMYSLDCFRIDARTKKRGTLELQWIEELKDQYFKEDTIDLTKEQVNNIILAKKQEIIQICENDLVCNPSDKTDADWYKEALDLLKIEALRNRILLELGGLNKVTDECTAYAEQFRKELEKLYVKNPQYCGMDKMISEGAIGSSEGIFGWKHFNHSNQLLTSIDKNISQIGGSRLIGPRYVLNDTSQIDAYQSNTDVRTKPWIDAAVEQHLEFIPEIISKPTEDFFEIAVADLLDPYKTIDRVTEERKVSFEQFSNDISEIAVQFGAFTLNLSELNGPDLLVSVEVDNFEEIEVITKEQFKTPLEEDSKDIVYYPLENVDIPNKVKEARSMVFEITAIEPKASFLSDNSSELFEINESQLNHERVGITKADTYSFEHILTESKFKTTIENCDGKMFKVNADSSETILKTGTI